MSESPALTDSKTPVHLWIVGVVSLLWNAFGAFDYLMTQFDVEAYMSQFTPEQFEYFTSFPSWTVAAWAFGVWGGLVGSIGLLVRKRWAVWAFGISLAGMIISSIYTLGLSEGIKLMGPPAIIMSAVIWVVAIALLLYARAQASKGVLR